MANKRLTEQQKQILRDRVCPGIKEQKNGPLLRAMFDLHRSLVACLVDDPNKLNPLDVYHFRLMKLEILKRMAKQGKR